MKRIAIIQSCYIPWKGYFDIINSVDEFVLFDDVQYTKRDWRNRNKIKTDKGTKWLSIPISVKGNYFQKIFECQVLDNKWAKQHWNNIVHYYKNAPYFSIYASFFQDLFEKCKKMNYLSHINFLFIQEICKLVGIETSLTWSMDYEVSGERSDRLLSICKKSCSTEYLSGPSAKSYLNEEIFTENGIQVNWMSYDGYKKYDQLFSPPFVHEVSIIDLIFNVGACNAQKYFSSPQHNRSHISNRNVNS